MMCGRRKLAFGELMAGEKVELVLKLAGPRKKLVSGDKRLANLVRRTCSVHVPPCARCIPINAPVPFSQTPCPRGPGQS